MGTADSGQRAANTQFETVINQKLALQCGNLLLQLSVHLINLGAAAAATLAANDARRR